MKKSIWGRAVSYFIIILMISMTLAIGVTDIRAANKYDDLIFEVIYFESLNEEMINNPYRNLSKIEIGCAIPAYTIYNGGAIQTEAIYIPVFSSGELVSIATISFDNRQVSSVEISNELVDEIDNYRGNKIALVFDNTSTFILCNSVVKMIRTYKNEIEVDHEKELKYKDTISDLAPEKICKIKTSKVSSTIKFSMSEEKKIKLKTASNADNGSLSFTNSAVTMATTSYPEYKYLSVKIVLQGDQPICWAAAVACIGNYKTGKTYSASDVSMFIYGENKGGTTAAAQSALTGLYGLEGVDVYYAPPLVIIKSEINEGDPIYTRISGTNSSGTVRHALTIIGYYDYPFSISSYDGLLRYNDSNYSSYKCLYFTTAGVYKITYNGVSSKIDQYIKIY